MMMTLRTRRSLPTPRSPSPPPAEIISTKKRKKKMISRKFPKAKPNPNPRRKRNYNAVSSSDSESESKSESESEQENLYESIREQRIRENKERMEKLGIFSLSSQMFNAKKRPVKNVPKKKRYPPIVLRPPRSYESRRKSDRLKDLGHGTYFESEKSLKEMGISIPVGWKSEVYTEKDEKLLGDCVTKWTLKEDGFGEDGELLYDLVYGTPCHQCRNKTQRKHTYCTKCRSPMGQLCGDCLYMRYGENVLETIQNPNWMCPACRGICNCSRCRREKGWVPVTVQHSKVISMGFKSIAHYLILNNRGGNLRKESEDATVTVDLTEQENPAGSLYVGSDTSSSEWSDSGSDDDSDTHHSKNQRKVMKQPEDHEIAHTEPCNEDDDGDVKIAHTEPCNEDENGDDEACNEDEDGVESAYTEACNEVVIAHTEACNEDEDDVEIAHTKACNEDNDADKNALLEDRNVSTTD